MGREVFKQIPRRIPAVRVVEFPHCQCRPPGEVISVFPLPCLIFSPLGRRRESYGPASLPYAVIGSIQADVRPQMVAPAVPRGRGLLLLLRSLAAAPLSPVAAASAASQSRGPSQGGAGPRPPWAWAPVAAAAAAVAAGLSLSTGFACDSGVFSDDSKRRLYFACEWADVGGGRLAGGPHGGTLMEATLNAPPPVRSPRSRET